MSEDLQTVAFEEFQKLITEVIDKALEAQEKKVVEHLVSSWTEAMDLIMKGLDQRFLKLEERLEQMEQTEAILTAAYGELTVMIEALVARVGDGSPEEIQAFHDSVNEGRKKLITTLRDFNEAQPFKQHKPDPSGMV